MITVTAACLLLPGRSEAQTHQTLFGWEEETRLMIQNSYHNHGGIFYDRGLFRFTTPGFTKEHDLDLISYNFTPVEHHSWYYENEGNSFRTFMGSFNLGQFLHGVEIRNNISLTDRLDMPLHLVRRYDMRVDRTLLLLAFNYQLADGHRVGLRHTLNEYKPDFDATVFYQYGRMPEGGFRVDVTAGDWATNAAYKLGQKRGTEMPEMRSYDVKPYLFSFKSNTPLAENVRLETMAGVQTPLTAVAGSMPEYPAQTFRDRDLGRYAGLLLEYARPQITAGVSLRHTYARFSRSNAPGSDDPPQPEAEVDYGNRQIQNSLGGFLALSHRRFYIHNWIWRNYNLDTQWDHHEERTEHGVVVYPFDFREFRWQKQIRIGYNPDRPGFTISAEWSSDWRRPAENYVISDELHSRGLPYRILYPNTLGLNEQRLTLQFGYRFTNRSYLILGASLDLDGDRHGGYWDRTERDDFSRFDGGFGRFVIYY